jgi:hypothetical protein
MSCNQSAEPAAQHRRTTQAAAQDQNPGVVRDTGIGARRPHRHRPNTATRWAAHDWSSYTRQGAQQPQSWTGSPNHYPGCGWPGERAKRFGTHPVQVITEVNSAAHVADSRVRPCKRALTGAELQALFDFADEQVGGKQMLGRKGWLSAFRDATCWPPTDCDAPRPGCWTSPISARIRRGQSSASTGVALSATAMPRRDRRRNVSVC